MDVATPAACQNYYFTVTDANAQTLRYPATGDFLLEGRTCASGIIAFRDQFKARFGRGMHPQAPTFDLNGRRVLFRGFTPKL